MSYNVNHKGTARDVDGRHEQLIEIEKHRQGGLQKTALEATKSFVTDVAKHARLSDHEARVETFGHFNDDGTGYASVRIDISRPVPVPVEPIAPVEPTTPQAGE